MLIRLLRQPLFKEYINLFAIKRKPFDVFYKLLCKDYKADRVLTRIEVLVLEREYNKQLDIQESKLHLFGAC